MKNQINFFVIFLFISTSRQEIDHYNYDDLYTYAQQKTRETKIKNEKLFNKSINTCEYKPVTNESFSETSLASSNNEEYFLDLALYSGSKLILLDDSLIALLSSSNKSIRIYDLDLQNSSLTLMHEVYFHHERPFDLCTDKTKYIFLVFPNENRVAKYLIRKAKDGQINFKRIKYITDSKFNPTAIACNFNFIYVSERTHNQIRVYDKRLNLIDIINLDGVIVNVQKTIIIERNLKVFVDGFDAVGLFDNKSRFNNSLNTCHFYKKIMCIQDVSIYTNIEDYLNIYVLDTCDKDIKEFLFKNRLEKIKLNQVLKIGFPGEPVSVSRNSFNQMILLTSNPNRLNVFKLHESI